MKKIILFVSAFALLLTSCSSDDSDPEPAAPTGTLLTKIIETYDDKNDVINVDKYMIVKQ